MVHKYLIILFASLFIVSCKDSDSGESNTFKSVSALHNTSDDIFVDSLSDDYVVIDVRSSNNIQINPQENATVVSFAELSDVKTLDMLNSYSKKLVIVGDDLIKSHAAWMYLKVQGLENIYIYSKEQNVSLKKDALDYSTILDSIVLGAKEEDEAYYIKLVNAHQSSATTNSVKKDPPQMRKKIEVKANKSTTEEEEGC